MPDESDFNDDESAARKRQLNSTPILHTPAKRAKQASSAFGLFFTPIQSLLGMFQSKSSKDSSSPPYSASNGEDKDVVTLATVTPNKELKGRSEIVFLNAEKAESSTMRETQSEEDVIVEEEIINKTKSLSPKSAELVYLSEDKPSPSTHEVQDEEEEDDEIQEIVPDVVMVEEREEEEEEEAQHEISAEKQDENDEVQEVAQEEVFVEKPDELVVDPEVSVEKQDDDEVKGLIHFQVMNRTSEVQEEEVEVVGEVRRKSTDTLSSALRIQNQLVFLNEDNEGYEQEPAKDDDIIEIDLGMSPTPDDSASRSGTPNIWNSTMNSESRKNIRDYWRRPSSAKNARSGARQFGTPFIGRLSQSGIKKRQPPKPSALDLYTQELIKAGIWKERDHSLTLNTPGRREKKRIGANCDALIKKAKKAIHEIKSSREGTIDSRSRSSTFLSDDSSRRASSPSPAPSFSDSTAETKMSELFSRMKAVDFRNEYGTDIIPDSSEANRIAEMKLSEELRIRSLNREQKREDTVESVRKKLELHGIVIRPKKVKKVAKTEFVVLPPESDLLCDRAWNLSQPADELFVEDFNIPLTRKDLLTLNKLNWLNDEVINFYLQLVVRRSQLDENYPKTFAFNTFFYPTLVNKGYALVRRWTKSVDFFSFDVVVIPVHLSLHWCMAVIDLKQKRVDYYDSLLGRNQKCLDALKEYLMKESMDKKKVAFDYTGWTFNTMEDIPVQKNGSDCGVFSCQFGEFASRRARPVFTQEHMPYYRKRMLYELCNKSLLSSI